MHAPRAFLARMRLGLPGSETQTQMEKIIPTLTGFTHVLGDFSSKSISIVLFCHCILVTFAAWQPFGFEGNGDPWAQDDSKLKNVFCIFMHVIVVIRDASSVRYQTVC